MKYAYEKDEMSGNSEQEYKITEQYTSSVIIRGLNYREAQTQCKHFNKGGAFFGFTPSFFLNKLT